MTRLIGGILAIGIVAVPAGVCLGHGAHCDIIDGAAAIEARYHDGNPMAFCDVEVFRPGEGTEVFQTGVTDSHGRFVFVPDTTGEWKVTVDDGMGHLAAARFSPGTDEVPDESAGVTGHTGSAEDGDRIREVVMGIAVIFGLFGVMALFYCRRKVR